MAKPTTVALQIVAFFLFILLFACVLFELGEGGESLSLGGGSWFDDKDAPSPDPRWGDGTAAPRRAENGAMLCTRCGAAVAYECMRLTQDGYFCPACNG